MPPHCFSAMVQQLCNDKMQLQIRLCQIWVTAQKSACLRKIGRQNTCALAAPPHTPCATCISPAADKPNDCVRAVHRQPRRHPDGRADGSLPPAIHAPMARRCPANDPLAVMPETIKICGDSKAPALSRTSRRACTVRRTPPRTYLHPLHGSLHSFASIKFAAPVPPCAPATSCGANGVR